MQEAASMIMHSFILKAFYKQFQVVRIIGKK